MKTKVLTIPGFHGSDKNHWQTWLEQQLPDSERIAGIDWERPQILTWARTIEEYLDATSDRLILVAHSFGCLASAIAASRHGRKIAGLILVAPASPQRFSLTGPRAATSDRDRDISSYLPAKPLATPGLLVASTNDPWVTFDQVQQLSTLWKIKLHNAGNAGHINSKSGYGEWPLIKEIIQTLPDSIN